MSQERAHRLAVIAQELDRQNRQWAVVESELRELAHLGVAVSREVLSEIDAAFASPISSSAQPTFLTALLG